MQNKQEKLSLLLASKEGRTETVKALIGAKADVDLEDEDGKSPLHFAANGGHTDIVKALIEAKANVNARDSLQETPLLLAVGKGHSNIVQALISANADVDLKDKKDQSPLYLAVVKGHPDIVKALMEANANTQNKHGATPLLLAAWEGYSYIAKALITGKAVDLKNIRKRSALYFSVGEGHADTVKTLVESGADVCYKDIAKVIIKYTVLHNYDTTKPDIVADKFQLSEFWDDCKNQVEQMQHSMLGTSNISLLKFVQETDGNKLVSYVSNVNTCMQEELERGCYAVNFPTYTSMIADQFNKARKREYLLHKSNKIMEHCDLEILPAEIRDKISSFLTNAELKNLVKSAFNAPNRNTHNMKNN